MMKDMFNIGIDNVETTRDGIDEPWTGKSRCRIQEECMLGLMSRRAEGRRCFGSKQV